ncbi:unnamed protein product [Pseudo-nitzschia multistriata]|uniref:Uncharacterized protein n=1 Tax=Pseudo-nitzschia multistriata TaxID=183589 RepID=A0A448Z9J8_9STRA|nr:unnamed protein product [Pseudo-nitzschia multistriata]
MPFSYGRHFRNSSPWVKSSRQLDLPQNAARLGILNSIPSHSVGIERIQRHCYPCVHHHLPDDRERWHDSASLGIRIGSQRRGSGIERRASQCKSNSCMLTIFSPVFAAMSLSHLSFSLSASVPQLPLLLWSLMSATPFVPIIFAAGLAAMGESTTLCTGIP